MSPSSEQYAQIAALFTTAEDEAIKTTVELLIPAHLPVQGGLWLVPYAGRAAGEGNAMLVRMHDETIDFASIGNITVELEACNSIETILSNIDSPVSHWIVQPPADGDAVSLLHGDPDIITLLSGADQAAVVGAYRLLKNFVTASKDQDALPPIRIVIVGAEERAANDASSRIVQTAKHQLGIHVEVGHPLPAMGSQSKVQSQCSIPRSCNLIDLLSRLRTSSTQEDVLETTTRVLPEFPVEQIEEKTTPHIAEESEQGVLVEDAVVEKVIASEAALSSYVDGLLSIKPRCPEHTDIELALDSEGNVHVLAHAESFRETTIVAAWVNKHRDLISMACGGIEMSASGEVIQHFFTDDAVSVAELHGTGVKLHLLTEVQTGGTCVPFSTPLN